MSNIRYTYHVPVVICPSITIAEKSRSQSKYNVLNKGTTHGDMYACVELQKQKQTLRRQLCAGYVDTMPTIAIREVVSLPSRRFNDRGKRGMPVTSLKISVEVRKEGVDSQIMELDMFDPATYTAPYSSDVMHNENHNPVAVIDKMRRFGTIQCPKEKPACIPTASRLTPSCIYSITTSSNGAVATKMEETLSAFRTLKTDGAVHVVSILLSLEVEFDMERMLQWNTPASLYVNADNYVLMVNGNIWNYFKDEAMCHRRDQIECKQLLKDMSRVEPSELGDKNPVLRTNDILKTSLYPNQLQNLRMFYNIERRYAGRAGTQHQQPRPVEMKEWGLSSAVIQVELENNVQLFVYDRVYDENKPHHQQLLLFATEGQLDALRRYINATSLYRVNIPLRGAFLSDEVGCGKTLSMISLMCTGKKPGFIGGPSRKYGFRIPVRGTLVVVPAGTPLIQEQWIPELEKHAPELTYCRMDTKAAISKTSIKDVVEADVIFITSSTVGCAYMREVYATLSDTARAHKIDKISHSHFNPETTWSTGMFNSMVNDKRATRASSTCIVRTHALPLSKEVSKRSSAGYSRIRDDTHPAKSDMFVEELWSIWERSDPAMLVTPDDVETWKESYEDSARLPAHPFMFKFRRVVYDEAQKIFMTGDKFMGKSAIDCLAYGLSYNFVYFLSGNRPWYINAEHVKVSKQEVMSNIVKYGNMKHIVQLMELMMPRDSSYTRYPIDYMNACILFSRCQIRTLKSEMNCMSIIQEERAQTSGSTSPSPEDEALEALSTTTTMVKDYTLKKSSDDTPAVGKKRKLADGDGDEERSTKRSKNGEDSGAGGIEVKNYDNAFANITFQKVSVEFNEQERFIYNVFSEFVRERDTPLQSKRKLAMVCSYIHGAIQLIGGPVRSRDVTKSSLDEIQIEVRNARCGATSTHQVMRKNAECASEVFGVKEITGAMLEHLNARLKESQANRSFVLGQIGSKKQRINVAMGNVKDATRASEIIMSYPDVLSLSSIEEIEGVVPTSDAELLRGVVRMHNITFGPNILDRLENLSCKELSKGGVLKEEKRACEERLRDIDRDISNYQRGMNEFENVNAIMEKATSSSSGGAATSSSATDGPDDGGDDDEDTMCDICSFPYDNDTRRLAVTPCWHYFCLECILGWIDKKHTCPQCRRKVETTELRVVPKKQVKEAGTSADMEVEAATNDVSRVKQLRLRYGSKMTATFMLVSSILDESPEHKIVLFSAQEGMLQLINGIMKEYGIATEICLGQTARKANAVHRYRFGKHPRRKKNAEIRDPPRVLLLPVEKMSEGLNLTETTHLVFVDKSMSENRMRERLQATGRGHRLGQKHKNVYIIDIVVKDTVEEELYTELHEGVDKQGSQAAFTVSGTQSGSSRSLPSSFFPYN